MCCRARPTLTVSSTMPCARPSSRVEADPADRRWDSLLCQGWVAHRMQRRVQSVDTRVGCRLQHHRSSDSRGASCCKRERMEFRRQGSSQHEAGHPPAFKAQDHFNTLKKHATLVVEKTGALEPVLDETKPELERKREARRRVRKPSGCAESKRPIKPAISRSSNTPLEVEWNLVGDLRTQTSLFEDLPADKRGKGAEVSESSLADDLVCHCHVHFDAGLERCVLDGERAG